MIPQPPNSHEAARLAALHRYGLLEAQEKEFDDFTKLAAQICETPMAGISLVDQDRVWFKSETGLGVHEVPLQDAICRHAIQQTGIFLVPDTRLDVRFQGNPMVTGGPELRFYAGAPLETGDQMRLGTLCVMDREPRVLTDAQQQALTMLARQVMTMLELRLSRRLLHNTVESIRDAFFTLDHDFRFTYLNQQAKDALAPGGQELLGSAIVELCGHGEASPFLTQFRRAASLQVSVAFEQFYEPAGAWLDVRAYPSPDGLTVYFQDITARRKSEEEHRLLETCVSRLNDIVLITEAEPIDEPGPRILYVNDAFVRRTGYSREETIGRSPRFLQGSRTQRDALDRIRASLKKWKPVREEFINYTKSGEEFWMELDIVPVADATGWYTHWIAIERDITERKRAEEALCASEERFRMIVQTSPDLIFILRDDAIHFVNDAGVALLGAASEKDVLGRSPLDFFHPSGHGIVRRRIAHLREEPGSVPAVEERMIRLDGTEIEVEVSAASYRCEGHLDIQVVCRDITARKAVETDLRAGRQRYKRQHAALVALTHDALRHSSDQVGMLAGITETVARALDVERVSFWKFSSDRSVIVCQDLFEASTRTHSSGQEFQIGSYPDYFHALDKSDVIPAVVASQDARTREFDEVYLKPLGITSILDAPIHVAWKLDGVLWIEHTGPRREWTHAEQSFAVSVANLVSLTLSQQAQALSEMRLRTIVESEPECVKIVSTEGLVLDINPAGLRMVEADDLDAVRHRPAASFVHPDDLGAYQKMHHASCQGESGQLEFRIIGLKGTLRWMETHATPLREADGRIASVLSVTRDVTARRLAAENLRASEASMATAQRIAHFGSWELDLNIKGDVNANALRWSDEMFRIAGYEPGAVEVSNELFFKLAHADDHEAIRQAVADAIQSRTQYSIVHRLIRPDGEERIVHETAQIFFDEQTGAPSKMVGTAHDITEQRRAEAALRASENRFRAFMNYSPLACWIVDVTGVMRYVSPGYYRMIGVKEDIAGKNICDVFDADIAEVYLANNRAAIEGQRVVEAVEPGIRMDGSRGEVLVVKFPIIMPGDEPMLGGIAIDITERKKVEEKLREQATLLDKAQDAIIVRSLDHRVLYWNQSAERLYGFTAQEALGRSVEEMLYQNAADFLAATHTVVTRGEWAGELRQYHKRGEELIVDCHWTLVRDPEGNPKSILAINTDITQRKKLEGQFLRAQRMESIGTLAGGIAHDLNNVLAPIMLSIDLLKLKVSDPAGQETLAAIGRSAQRGAEMISQVLSFARGMEGRRVEVQIRHLVRDLLKIAAETFPKNLRIEDQLSADLWTLEADPTQLHQVLMNLCVNARDAMPGGGQITITGENMVIDEHYAAMNIEARVGPHVRIEVEDTGVGIPKDIIDKIFDPFFTTKEVGKGTGLGLSTTLAIVKSHGGFIRVYSDVGMGTKFRIYLPAQSSSAQVKSDNPPVELPRGSGETILVVDDEASVRQITKQTLEAFGYRVLLACDGSEAVSIYVQHQSEISVVLTDMMMPVMDGPATIRVLLRLNRNARIIAASGITANGKVAQSVDAGVKRFLPKPYTAETLLKAVHLSLTDGA